MKPKKKQTRRILIYFLLMHYSFSHSKIPFAILNVLRSKQKMSMISENKTNYIRSTDIQRRCNVKIINLLARNNSFFYLDSQVNQVSTTSYDIQARILSTNYYYYAHGGKLSLNIKTGLEKQLPLILI